MRWALEPMYWSPRGCTDYACYLLSCPAPSVIIRVTKRRPSTVQTPRVRWHPVTPCAFAASEMQRHCRGYMFGMWLLAVTCQLFIIHHTGGALQLSLVAVIIPKCAVEQLCIKPQTAYLACKMLAHQHACRCCLPPPNTSCHIHACIPTRQLP